VTARRTQQLFGNISTEKLMDAQNWTIEKNIASFLLELLRSVSVFIDTWIDFFNISVQQQYNFSFPNSDFWKYFIQPSIGDAVRDKLARVLVEKCNDMNQYSLYTLVNVADYFANLCQSRDFSGPLS
jgi:hypothetical protein